MRRVVPYGLFVAAVLFVGVCPPSAGGGARVTTVAENSSREPDVLKEVQELVKTIEGVEVRRSGRKIILEGTVLTDRDKEKVDRIAEQYPQVVNLVHVDRQTEERLLADEIRRRLNLPSVLVRVVGRKAILEGEVYDEASRERAEQVATAYADDVVNLISIRRPMIEMDLQIIRLDLTEGESTGGNLLKKLRIGGSASTAPGDGQPTYGLSAEAGTTLDVLVHRGVAKVLSQSHLSTRSGEKARFHSGGEIGFRVKGRETSDIKFKDFGLIIEIEPRLKGTDEILSHVAIEVSAPAGPSDSSGDVGFTKFSTESEIVGRANETIVIAGLAETLRSRFREQTPLLGQIPVLRLFFGETQHTTRTRDLLVLITPTIAPVVRFQGRQPQSTQHLDKTLQEPPDAGGEP